MRRRNGGAELSLFGPKLNQQHGLNWIILTWFSLLTTAIIGFLQIYAFSKRFRSKVDDLDACMIADVIVQAKGSEEKLEEFLWKSHQAQRRFKCGYKWCVGLMLAQGIFPLLSFIFFGLCLDEFRSVTSSMGFVNRALNCDVR